MRFVKVDTSAERQLLIGIIVSETFTKKILPILEYEYLDLSPVKTVAKWCIEYYQKYSRVPAAAIQDIFKDKKRGLKEDDAKWIEEFLASISQEYEKEGFNEDYLFDSCVKYFKRQRLLQASKRVTDLLEKGKEDEAQEAWLSGITIPQTDDLGIDPFDPDTIRRLLKSNDSRVSLKLGIPDLDRMTGPLKSGWLAVFMGPMKRGKTWALVYTAIAALMRGYNVVFVSLESEELDNALRFWMNVGNLASDKDRLDIPYFDGEDVKHDTTTRPFATESRVVIAAKKFSQAIGPSRFKLKVYPMGTASMQDIRNYLNVLEVYENFSPHVVIVDYLGIIKKPAGVKEEDKWDANSVDLKALAQERKAVVITGHQGTRDAMEKMSMVTTDTSRDVRVIANVDVLYGLNQTEKEMDDNVMRVNVLAHRHHKYTKTKEVMLLQQFGAGQFVLDSKIIDKPAYIPKRKRGEKDVEE